VPIIGGRARGRAPPAPPKVEVKKEIEDMKSLVGESSVRKRIVGDTQQ